MRCKQIVGSCLLGVLFLSMTSSEPVFAKKKPKKKSPTIYTVDTFKDENFYVNPKWWYFGDVELKIESNDGENMASLGQYALSFNGTTAQWYIGGVGVYMGVNATAYTHLKILMYSPKENGGLLAIQLFDDDNQNWEVDIDNASATVIHDDVFVHNLLLDWEGWKTIQIPLSEFKDSNPNQGDNVWNPVKGFGSGGLIQMQILAFGAKHKKESVSFKIDSVKLIDY